MVLPRDMFSLYRRPGYLSWVWYVSLGLPAVSFPSHHGLLPPIFFQVKVGSFEGPSDVAEALKTKGGDPVAAVPKFDLPDYWTKTVPYSKYSEDWYQMFLVDAK